MSDPDHQTRHGGERDAPGDAPARGADAEAGWFRHLRRHPVWPVILYIAVSMVLKENYPFSHFPMYSDPSPKPLSYSYIADGTGRDGALGEPVPLLYYTGLTPSALHKRLGFEKGKFEKKDKSLSEAQVSALGAAETLKYVRSRNRPRQEWGSKRFLPETIQYVRVRILRGDGEFDEVPEVLAEHHEPRGEGSGGGARE